MDIQKTYGIFNKSAQKAEELRETKWAQFFETPCKYDLGDPLLKGLEVSVVLFR